MAWIIPLMCLLFAAYAHWQNMALTILFWPSLIAGTLLLFTAKKSEAESRLRNFSGLLMIAAFTVTLSALLAQNGFALVAMELTLLIALIALAVGWIFKSKPSVLLSTFATLLYLSNHYPELGLMSGLTEKVSLLGAGLVPWVILGQIFLAQKLKSSIVLLTSIIAGYIWFGTFATGMPLSALMGLFFAIAASHYWLSKAWDERNQFGANVHKIFAWIVALAAAVYIQSMWLSVDAAPAKPFWPPSTLWLSIMGAAMLTLFVTSISRYKTSHVSLAGIFIVCSAVFVISIATIKPDWIHAIFDAIPGLDARPGLGLIIGAMIIASGFMWIVSGLKRGELANMSLGAAAIGIEALVLFQPDRFNADLGVIFIGSLICALCIGGLIAGATPEHKHSLKNFA